MKNVDVGPLTKVTTPSRWSPDPNSGEPHMPSSVVTDVNLNPSVAQPYTHPMYFACFYVAYPYYFPHFLPISEEMQRRGHKVHYLLSREQNAQLMEKIAQDNHLDYSFTDDTLNPVPCEFTFFANPHEAARSLESRSVFLEHGIGSKSMGFYSAVEYFDIYLVEGDYKRERVTELYPEHQHKLRQVGFSKLDPIINMSASQRREAIEKYGLSPDKKTVLYAPTFFPSSIERMADSFPDDLSDYNVLIKPHYLTYERRHYKRQRAKLSLWNRADNCCVVGIDEYNLVPLFAISDVMISDESSAMFEFASLDRPVVSNRYVKLRLSYYLMPWKINRRIDNTKDKYRQILHNAHSYKETIKLTQHALASPADKADLRQSFASEICGTIDGKVSQRIVDMLEHETL